MIIKEKLVEALVNYRREAVSKIGLQDDLKLKISNKSLPPLTAHEEDEIKKIWGSLIRKSTLKRGLIYYRLCKKLRSFDALYVPAAYYVPYICFVLNERNYIKSFVHKSLIDLHFQDVKRPQTMVKSIGGVFYDNNNKLMSKDEVISLLEEYPEELIVKKSTESSGGKGIVFIKDYRKDELSKLLNEYNDDIIIQRLIKQSASTAVFNEKCINSFRVTTLNLNGRTSVLSRVFKMGALGLKVDNSGAGGVMIGIDKAGKLDDKGFLANGQVVTEFNKIIVKNVVIPEFKKVEETAIQLHSRIDHIHIIGWDIALDEKDEPVLIEANATWPGITVEQLCTGPIFADRTLEVIEYCKNKQSVLPNKVFATY